MTYVGHTNDSLTNKLNFLCWNVQGWTNSDKGEIECSVRPNDIRAKVIAVLQPETWLQGNESVKVDNYRWIGNNRKQCHSRAMRGSGGVGLLVNNKMFMKYNVQVLDESREDVLWALLNPNTELEVMESIVVCVCHLLLLTSSRGDNPDTFYDSIIDSLHHYCNLGCVTICGDLNARCGIETDLHEDLVSYIQSIDEHKNHNGDMMFVTPLERL